ncbi:UbiA family prenyltransferase [Flavobacterium sp. DGU11]|uniref:UbiA family prenyltransferase n=1 Tax=Flavobacterium arundinis TaxID=3139143 RepID=A0ABU9HWM7_9FLAO
MKILKLIELPNLLLLTFAMLVFHYGFLDQQQSILPALNGWQYGLFTLSCVFIAAGGFLMNNVAGIGRPETGLTEAQGYNLYIALTLIGVGFGYYIANFVGKPMYVGIFGVAAATIYIYATSLKQTLLISNIIVALIMALPVVAIGIFNLYPILTPDNQPILATLFSLLLDYAIFIFTISLLLTFVNDLANTDSDYNSGITTLPIVMGKDRTIKAVCASTIVPMAMLVYYANTYIIDLLWALGYGLLFIGGPMIYFIIKLWAAKTQKDFKHLELVLKLVLFFTAISMAVITFNIKYNAQG